MREGRKVTMGRYSRKQSACAGKESAEDFGKRREDQREISAHLQLNYANTPPCGCAGVTFFSLIRPLHEPFVCFPIIWITHRHYPVQLDYANTSPFRCVGSIVCFFLLPQEYFIYFFTSIIRRLLGVSDHINCPKQFSSVNALPYRV